MEESGLCKEVIQLGVKYDHLEEKVNNLSGIERATVEISATLKYMKETEQQREQLYQKQSETLQNVSRTIERINDRLDRNENEIKDFQGSMKDTNEKLESIDNKIDTQNVENIKDGSISWNKIWKGGVMAGLTILAAFLMSKLGIVK